MEQEARRKGPRSPSEESDNLRRRAKKYDRSPSPRRRYRRSRSRSSSRERSSRRKESSREHEWKANMQQTANKASNPANTTGYPQPVLNQYNAPPPPNTSQPPPPIQYTPGYGNYNYNYNQGYADYGGYQQAPGYRNDYPPANWQGNVPYNSQQQQQQQQAAAAAAVAAVAAAAAVTMPQANRGEPPQQRVVDPAAQAALIAAAATSRPEEAKKEAIAAELKQQKATLAKQREEYVKKSSTLQRELEILRKQCEEIGKEGGRENTRIIKENQKLQVEIQNKMKSIHNVIDMLTGIIGDKVTVEDLKVKYKPESVKRSKSPKEEFSTNKSSGNTPNSEGRDEESKPAYNFVHYDPEMHWCKTCDIFPKTAKEYLNHLHSNEHKEMVLERKIVDMPWHDSKLENAEKEMPYYPGLPTKRTPIKGLQFFSPATAWYCKLCHAWIGDLHCASLHLKSRRHSENYSHFVDQNPHWETDWMADREKAFSDEKHKQIQMEIQKQKDDAPPTKPKKAKKAKKNKKKAKKRKTKSSNSESSSESESNESDANGIGGIEDASRSIRVAMRNKMKASGQPIHNDEENYGNNEVSDDRQMVNSLRDKMKAKQDLDSKQGKKEVKPESYNNTEAELQAWGPKEPPKSFWIKKDEDNKVANQPVTKPDEIPKPHMGFWTKQQIMPVVKPVEKEKEKERDDERDRDRDRYKDDRREVYGNKWDRRDDKYERGYRDERYDRRRGSGRDRERDYYDSRSGRRRESNESPRHERNWNREGSPKRGYDGKYNRDDESNDDGKYKKSGEPNSKMKKSGAPGATKKAPPQVMKGKLPFIGRLPLFKKKDDGKQPEKELMALPYTQSKFEDTPKVPSEIINPPGVVHVPKLATPVALPNNTAAIKAQQMKILVAPPPPTLNEKQQQANITTAEVVDMEIEDQSEEVLIEQNLEETKDTSKPPPPIPNTSRPPPGYPKKPEPAPTPFTHQGPPPPFVTNTFMHPPNQPPPVQQMPYMHQMQMPPPGMYANPPPPLPPTAEALPGVPGVPVAEVPEIPEPAEKRPDGAPLPEDLQEALDIIFPADEQDAAANQHNQDNTIMYGSVYSMLGCVGYGPDYMDQPPPEITQQEPELETAPGPDDLRMLGIDEGDTIL